MAKNTNSNIEHKKYYYPNRNIRAEFYYVNGENHRTDGPAIISYYDNGNINYKYYFINDELHRTNGPAIIEYYKNGNIESKTYYLYGDYVNVNSDKEFIKWQKTQILK
jgi:antitoxin component YwqK of YwqJK toxin-antitoxin module